MESYTDLDLHLQFVCFFRNKRLYIDRSNDQKYILPTSKLTGNKITGVKCIQSVFLQCKLQESHVTNKTITGTIQYRN